MPIELNPPYWTGGPPYPSYATDEGKFGLSVLDWFAGHAIAGLMGSELIDQKFFDQFVFPEEQQLPSLKKPSPKEVPEASLPENPSVPAPPTPEQLAMIAYAIAGTMVEIRKNLPIEPKPVPSSEMAKALPVKLGAAQRETIAYVSNSSAPKIP